MALTDRNMLVRFCLKSSVYSLGWEIWVSSSSFQKINIGWPQQPPTEKMPNVSKKLDFSWSIPQKRTSIGHFGARDDQIIRIRKFFWWNWAFEASEVAEASEVNEAGEVSKAWIITTESSKFLNSIILGIISLYFDVFGKTILTESWKLMLNFCAFSVGGCWGQPPRSSKYIKSVRKTLYLPTYPHT